jgi:amidase
MRDPLPERLPNGKYVNGSINGLANGVTNVAVEQLQWKKTAAAKQVKREQILAAHQNWRLKEPVPSTMEDVSTLALKELTDREREIVHLDATDLVLSLRNGHYSAVEVTIAFCKVCYVFYFEMAC